MSPSVPKPPVSSEPNPPENLAEAPFDDARADLVLRSSDKVDFRVFKIILSLASPIFTDMFSIPLPPSDSKPSDDEVQVVSLSEHSTALDVALRHIYPVRTPEGDTLYFASILAEFARKYQVEALDKVITGYLTVSVERDPVGVYAVAVTYGYDGIGANAARSCLTLPFSRLQSPYLRFATAEHISELFRYHVACGEAASAFASSDRTWFSSISQNKIIEYITSQRNNCGSCYTPDSMSQNSTPSKGGRNRVKGLVPPVTPVRNGPRCLWNYLYRSALVLAHHPTAEAVTKEAFVQNTNDCTNASCVQDMRGHMLEISVVLGREIKKTVQQVSLSLCPLSRACDVQWCALIRGRFPYPGLWTLSTGLNRVLPYTRLMMRVSQNDPLL